VAEDLKSSYHINVEVVIADLSKDGDLSQLLQIVGKQKNVEVLVNNAGFGMDCRFSEDELDHQMAMLKVHVDAPVMLIKKVLPVMMENQKGVIINVSSLAAYMPTASNAMYTGTKSFLKNFTESLHLDVANYGIKVQCLCPGFTRSDFHRNHNISGEAGEYGPVGWMNPSEVVHYSIDCLNTGQVICIPGVLNRLTRLLITFIPRSLYYLISSRVEKKIRKPQHLPDFAFMKALHRWSDRKPLF
jgi:short-subunit dehydrogenase